MIKKKLYAWSCDYSKETGEGNLARLFAKRLNKKYQLNVITPKAISLNKLLNYRYFSPFVGLVFCWYYYLLKKNISYLNYLPMWNFILFLLLPPTTILGPITGGSHYKNQNLIIRKYLFPIFYKISEIALFFRNCEIIFSTDLLKKYISKKILKKSKFNYIFEAYNKKKIKKKNIDLVLYYRKHKNKEEFFPRNLISELIKKKYVIHIIGDNLKIKGVKNHGKVNQNKINKILSRSKFSIASGESLYTFFIFDCINNNVKIFVDKKNEQKIFKFKDSFIKLNFNIKNISSYF